jgi:hypothetical protein
MTREDWENTDKDYHDKESWRGWPPDEDPEKHYIGEDKPQVEHHNADNELLIDGKFKEMPF